MKISVLTLTLITLLTTFTSCSKEEDAPIPVATVTPTPVTEPTHDCSTLILCLTDDWILDSTQYFNNGVIVMNGLPVNSSVGMILNADGTGSNGPNFSGTWSLNETTKYLELVNIAKSGTVTLNGDQLAVADTTNGSLGNNNWTDAVWHYSRR